VFIAAGLGVIMLLLVVVWRLPFVSFVLFDLVASVAAATAARTTTTTTAVTTTTTTACWLLVGGWRWHCF